VPLRTLSPENEARRRMSSHLVGLAPTRSRPSTAWYTETRLASARACVLKAGAVYVLGRSLRFQRHLVAVAAGYRVRQACPVYHSGLGMSCCGTMRCDTASWVSRGLKRAAVHSTGIVQQSSEVHNLLYYLVQSYVRGG
jgi:hypothetical protein